MKKVLGKSKIALILIACTMLFSSCSSSDQKPDKHNESPNNLAGTNDEEQDMTSDENMENDSSNSDIEENIPKSEFFISKMSIGSFFLKSSMDITSNIDKEVMETLSEYNAIGIEDGAMLTLPENILFDFDSAQLRSEADEIIKQLIQVIDSADGDVTIVGHTDSHGEDSYNQTLSEDRAEAVLEALVDAGVQKDRLKAEGRGSTEPVAQNEHSDGSDNPEGRQKNRRVEVTIQGLN